MILITVLVLPLLFLTHLLFFCTHIQPVNYFCLIFFISNCFFAFFHYIFPLFWPFCGKNDTKRAVSRDGYMLTAYIKLNQCFVRALMVFIFVFLIQANFFKARKSQIRKFLSSFSYRKSENVLGITVCKSPILYLWLIRKLQVYKILHNSVSKQS